MIADPYRLAKTLAHQRGQSTIQIVGSKALQMHTSGDAEDQSVWCQILYVIQQLQRTEREGSNERKH